MAKDPICGMEVSETTPLKARMPDGKTYFFCSAHCLNKFLEENKTAVRPEISSVAESGAHCPSCNVSSAGMRFYQNKTFIIAAILAGLSLLSFALPFLAPFRQALWLYTRKIWWAVVLGLLIGGVIDYLVPQEYIARILARPRKRTIFYSVILGFLMSACSHGILAISVALYKKGAPPSSVVSFLLASPWANMTMTFMLVGFFGLKAFYIIISAIIIALVTGIIFQVLEKKDLVEKNPNAAALPDDNFSIIKDASARLKNYSFTPQNLNLAVKGILSGAVSLGDMVLWWILLGIGISSLLGAYVPAHIFHRYLSPTVGGLLLTLLIATIIEVCSEGTAPIAFEIYRQTRALGNSFVFLMAGVATDYTEIGILWTNIGRRTALWMTAITLPQIIFLGIIANIIFR